MLTPEETARLKELQANENRTGEEIKELQELVAKQMEADDNEFDRAFDEAMGVKPEVDKEEEQPTETQSTEEEDDTSGSDDPAPETEDTPAQGDPLATGEPAEPATETPDLAAENQTLKEQMEAMSQRMKSWEGRIAAANKRAEEAEARLKQEATEQQDKSDDVLPVGEGEEDADLREFVSEFPDLVKPIHKLAGKIAEQIVDRKLASITPRLEQVSATVEESTFDSHLERITTAHPDWRQIRDSGKLAAWVKGQPKFMQPQLQRVIDDGETSEIIEMFDTYKLSVGESQTKQTPTTNSTTSESKKAKAKALAAVPSSSGGPPKDTYKNKDDYDSAWDEATSKK